MFPYPVLTYAPVISSWEIRRTPRHEKCRIQLPKKQPKKCRTWRSFQHFLILRPPPRQTISGAFHYIINSVQKSRDFTIIFLAIFATIRSILSIVCHRKAMQRPICSWGIDIINGENLICTQIFTQIDSILPYIPHSTPERTTKGRRISTFFYYFFFLLFLPAALWKTACGSAFCETNRKQTVSIRPHQTPVFFLYHLFLIRAPCLFLPSPPFSGVYTSFMSPHRQPRPRPVSVSAPSSASVPSPSTAFSAVSVVFCCLPPPLTPHGHPPAYGKI